MAGCAYGALNVMSWHGTETSGRTSHRDHDHDVTVALVAWLNCHGCVTICDPSIPGPSLQPHLVPLLPNPNSTIELELTFVLYFLHFPTHVPPAVNRLIRSTANSVRLFRSLGPWSRIPKSSFWMRRRVSAFFSFFSFSLAGYPDLSIHLSASSWNVCHLMLSLSMSSLSIGIKSPWL